MSAIRLAVLSAVFGSGAGGLWAQVQPGGKIGFYGSVIGAVEGIQSGWVGTHVDNGFGAGFRAAGNFNPHFGIEGVFAGSTNHYFAGYDAEAVNDTNALFFVHGGPVIHLLTGRFVPYVSPAAGIIGFVDKASFAYNFGGGFKIFASPRLALRLDARRYYTTLKETLGNQYEGIFAPFQDKLHFNETSTGFSYLFFGRR
jgi:hypothetical protein